MQSDDEDEDRGPNNTFDGLLRKLEDGVAVNDFGHEMQEYIRNLRKAAKRGNKRLVGKVTLVITMPMGADGYMLPAAKLTLKDIPKPARPESIIYTDEDGDINGAPVAKQLSLSEVKGGKGQEKKDPAVAPAKAL
jgi:hypothetical protein